MFTLLRNYIREQKNSWLQVFGLGFLIIIMVTTFLSLNFATTFLTNQYNNDIAQNELHQYIYINTPFTNHSDTRFNVTPYDWDEDNTFLENMNYFVQDENGNNTIVGDKLAKATFQIKHAPGYDDSDPNHPNYLYRFIFADSSQNLFIGEKFSQKFINHHWIDFKLSLPLNYPSEAQHLTELKNFAAMIEQYVYDPNRAETYHNQVNFFINSQAALEKFHEMVSNGKITYATRDYGYDDEVNESRIYQQFVIGMLYGDNVSWRRISTLTDIIMTGKTLSFIQTTPQDVIGAPILVKDGGPSLVSQPLKNDEILIYKDFAQQNNLKIGDSYIFAGHKFFIRGFATSTIAANKGYYFGKVDDKNQSVAFVNQFTFNEIYSDPYVKLLTSDFVVYNPDRASKNIDKTIDNYWLYSYFHQAYLKKLKNGTLGHYKRLRPISNLMDASFMQPENYNLKDYNNVFESVSLNQIAGLKSIFQQISSVFLTLIFVITTVIIFIIIFKMIDRNKQLIGILKANGYQSWKLNLALILSIIVPLILFAILGSIIAIFVSKFIITGFTSTFALISVNFSFYLLPTLLVIILPILVLFIISFLIVAYLLRTPPLTLINNSWSKKKYNFSIGVVFSVLTHFLIKKFNYRNKLVITNTFRSLGKMSLIVIVSFFASTLVLFALASNGLINNMLGLQFASINYKYGSQYDFDGNITNNFINANGDLLYKKEEVKDIKARPSLYAPIRQALVDWINDPNSHPIVNCRYGYIMGSELLKIRTEIIEPALSNPNVPQSFKDFWHKNQYFIDYLTNNNGKSNTDLMINFGLLAYNSNLENPYSQFNFSDAHDFNVNNFDSSIYYDNQINSLMGDWDTMFGTPRTCYGVNDNTANYLNPNFNITNFSTFSNLTLDNMKNSSWWQNQNFINTRNQLINKLGIKNPDTASVQIIPMVGSLAPAIKNKSNGGDGNSLNKTVIYRYTGLDKQIKYIIGVVYDGAKNLLTNNILMPEKWLDQIILGNANSNLISSFGNAKFTNLDSNELHNYLPIITQNNNYNFDISQISNSSYLNSKGITPGLKLLYDVNSIKELIKAQQYTFQVLLTFFGIFLVLLTMMIIIIISNINIRDNLILINILRSLGYSFFEISYIFLVVTLPLLIICGIFSIYVAPLLVGILSSSLTNFTNIFFPVVFRWWYYGLSFLTIILIYFISYLITWKLNVSHRHLVKLTK